MASPRLSEIEKVPSEIFNSEAALPGFVGQKTFKILNEMSSDLAGMGAGNLNFYENEMMVRQPTAMIHDPAMMTGPIQVSVI